MLHLKTSLVGLSWRRRGFGLQRIPRYRSLLETILQHTAMESTMHSKVEESLSTMGGIASKISTDVTLRQQKNKVCTTSTTA